MPRISGFDGIRGLSALAVVLTHLHIYAAAQDAGVLSSRAIVMIDGAAGVQAFFILSGFLITYLLVKERESTGRVSLWNFYVRRTLRIFPIYFLVLIAILLIGNWLETGVNRGSYVYAFLYSYNFIPREDYASLIGHTWSLAVEEHFYLLWPVTFVLLFHRYPRVLLWLLVAAVAGSHVLLEVLNAYTDLDSAYFVNRWTPVAGGHIAFGCWGALAIANGRPFYRTFLGSWTALALAIVLFASSLAPGLPHEHLRPLGMGLIIFWIFLNQKSRLTRALEFRPLAYLGTISYGIYMYQGFFLSTGPYRLDGQEWPPVPLLGLILLCVVAPLSYHFLERPIMRLRSKLCTGQTPRRPDQQTDSETPVADRAG